MPLIPARPPKKCYDVAATAVDSLLVPAHGGGSMSALPAPENELAAPHDVYTMDLPDVIKQSLRSAHRIGWRYLVMQGDKAVAAAEVQRPAKGGEPAFSHLNSGPFVHGSVEALSVAEQLPEVSHADFDVRLLRIPALYVMALWLHGSTRDILIPLGGSQSPHGGATAQGPLTPDRPYSPEDFFQALTPLAQQRAAFDDSPQSSAPGGKGSPKRMKKATTKTKRQTGGRKTS